MARAPLVLLLLVALVGGYARAVDVEDLLGGGKDQGHVDFRAVGPGAEAVEGGEKGEDHVDFRVDPAGSYQVETEVSCRSPAHICATRWSDVEETVAEDKGQGHVDFRIAVHADGRVDVNGEPLAACDPAIGCRLSFAWSPHTGALVVHVEDADGTLRSAQYALAGMPSEIAIAAAEIRALSVARQ